MLKIVMKFVNFNCSSHKNRSKYLFDFLNIPAPVDQNKSPI